MTNVALLSELETLKANNAALGQENDLLRQQIRNLKAMIWGARSEKLKAALLDQLSLFESSLEEEAAPGPKKRIVEQHVRKVPTRRPLPEGIEEREVHHDLDEGEKTCDCCGTELTHIGVSTRKEVAYVPAKLEIEKHIQHKYTCKTCDGVDNEGASIITKPMPKRILPGIFAHVTLLAYIIVSKYEDGTPLYRLEKSFKRLGVELSRKTMTHWVLRLSERLFALQELMLSRIKEAPWLGIDETRIELSLHNSKKMKNQKPGKRFTGSMRVIQCQSPEPIVVFKYEDSSTLLSTQEILDGYEGIFMSDGSSIYNIVKKSPKGNTPSNCAKMTHAGCLIHCRRNFRKLLPDGPVKLSRRTLTGRVLLRFALLYKLEREADAKGFSLEQRGEMRKLKSRRIMDRMAKDMERTMMNAGPRPALDLKNAVNYALNHWDTFLVFLDHPELPLDNNGTENAIRPFVIGRKNWLHASSRNGAVANAVMYSLISTAQANGFNTYDYLVKLFTELPYAETEAELQALLPIASNKAGQLRPS